MILIKGYDPKIIQIFIDKIAPKCLERVQHLKKIIPLLINYDDDAKTTLMSDKRTGNWAIVSSLSSVFLVGDLKAIKKHDDLNKIAQKDIHASLIRFSVEIANFLNTEISDSVIRRILEAKPGAQKDLQQELFLKWDINKENKGIYYIILHEIFNYNYIDKPIAYELTFHLGVNTCPYCNRAYINTIQENDKDIIRPTLDHFLPKSAYPIFAVSFYNLIPSCYYCNSIIKRVLDFDTDTHIHPHSNEYGQDAYFDFEFEELHTEIDHPSNYEIVIKPKKGIDSDTNKRLFGDDKKGSITTFKLEAIYQAHRDVVGELNKKCIKNGEFYLNTIQPFLDLLDTKKEDFFRFHFHNYYENENLNKRPLSKLTRDIVFKLIPELKESESEIKL
ncbi:MAG: hypothetical protein JNJ40_12565 [Bacteroidia bacterium]|nr:hypothetical protein [Bacteroidia bacterium]